MSDTDAKGVVVCQGRLSVSAGDAKGYVVCLDKTQRDHDKTECDELGLERVAMTARSLAEESTF